jgi:hypothetical protein
MRHEYPAYLSMDNRSSASSQILLRSIAILVKCVCLAAWRNDSDRLDSSRMLTTQYMARSNTEDTTRQSLDAWRWYITVYVLRSPFLLLPSSYFCVDPSAGKEVSTGRQRTKRMDIGVIQVQPKILYPIMHARRIGQSNNEPRASRSCRRS